MGMNLSEVSKSSLYFRLPSSCDRTWSLSETIPQRGEVDKKRNYWLPTKKMIKNQPDQNKTPNRMAFWKRHFCFFKVTWQHLWWVTWQQKKIRFKVFFDGCISAWALKKYGQIKRSAIRPEAAISFLPLFSLFFRLPLNRMDWITNCQLLAAILLKLHQPLATDCDFIGRNSAMYVCIMRRHL